ncbi:MAG: primosomal protein N' [Pseudohongiellaceae bacterium]
MNAEYYLKVAVPSPLRTTFDYYLPAGQAMTAKPGQRVKIPFGKRQMIGIIVAVSAESDFPREKMKPVQALLDAAPALDSATLELYLWASEYYHFPVGQALQVSLPKPVRTGKALILTGPEIWRLTAAGKSASTDDLKRAPQQQKLLGLLQAHEAMSQEAINRHYSISALPFVRALQQKGLIEPGTESPLKPEPEQLYGTDQPLSLNHDQQQCVTSVCQSLSAYSAHLVEGVTGSGKTEVYLQVIARVLEQGKQVLVLIPEIGLTSQTIKRFRERFRRTLVTLHSGLSDTDRFHGWLMARLGHADIIIGTRSAIFTPLANPGLIIVDEEHDPSYKQQDGFRYSARDLSLYRARLHNIPVLLGSATPSLESLHNALSGRYKLHRLQGRAGEATTPHFRFIDLRGEFMEEGFSQTLLSEIKFHLDKQQQVLVFLNRRGFAPVLQCHDCGWISTCPRCEKAYTLHQHPPGLRCHHCDTRHKLPEHCPDCTSGELLAIGMGTERIETVLKKYFPQLPVLRVDRDSTRKRSALDTLFEEIHTGAPCILIGTQMLAKGHHFPNVTLVAILDADSGLFSADFRGQEHMGQLLTQVSGRAGRGDIQGEVLIQTHHVDHPGLNTLVNRGYGDFARALLQERKNSHLPPFTHQALLKAEAASARLPEQFLEFARGFCDKHQQPNLQVLGPMPAPMEKKAGKFRFQLLLQADNRTLVHQYSRALILALEQHPLQRKVRWAIDIDPLDFT